MVRDLVGDRSEAVRENASDRATHVRFRVSEDGDLICLALEDELHVVLSFLTTIGDEFFSEGEDFAPHFGLATIVLMVSGGKELRQEALQTALVDCDRWRLAALEHDGGIFF